jgi:tetratricopeptide (TPR) repeat protein
LRRAALPDRENSMSVDESQAEAPKDVGQHDEQSQPTAPRGRLGSLAAWMKGHQLVTAFLVVAATTSVVGVVFAFLLLASPSHEVHVTVDMALEALDAGKLNEARNTATLLATQKAASFDDVGGAAFVLGVAAFQDAARGSNRSQKASYLVAARYLEDANDRGFPPQRKAQGLILLGKALYFGGRISASQPVLREAIRTTDDNKTKTELHRLLAEANLQGTSNLLPEALTHNDQYLAAKSLSTGQRDQGLLQRAQILFRMNRPAEYAAALDRISPAGRDRADVVVFQGRLRMREARELANKPSPSADDRRQAQQRYETAIQTLRRVQGIDTVDNEATRQATYLIGTCFVELGDARAAAEQFNRLRTIFPDTPEALAADAEEADLNRRLGRNEAAMACYRRLLGAIDDPDAFANPWFTAAELRERVVRAHDEYRRTGNYIHALQLTGMMCPLFPRPQTLDMRAGTFRQWGQALLTRAAGMPTSAAAALEREGRGYLRQAGRAHADLAQARIATNHYPDDLRDSAESYMAGHDYANAARMFRRFVDNDSRRRNPEALVGLGESLLALGELDASLESLRQCIDSNPTHPMSYRARLLASIVYREQNKPDAAEKLLHETLDDQGITPSSEAWQESLFALGELLHEMGRFDEAARRLEEAVQRRSDSPSALRGRYLLADAYRRQALTAKEKQRGDVVEAARAARAKDIRQWLTTARERYSEVKGLLSARGAKSELTSLEERTLRNCRFALGDISFDLGEYERAIKEYATITDAYATEPEVLQAYVQMVRAHERLNQTDSARRAAQHAKAVLERLKKDAAFTETTNHTRKQWEELFDSLTRS